MGAYSSFSTARTLRRDAFATGTMTVTTKTSHLVKKSYFRSDDEGLHFSSILATPDDWKKTFLGKAADAKALDHAQPLTMWIVCIDNE